VVGWCSESRENCEGPCDKWWLPNGAVDGCNARYESCSTDSDCCSPGVCVGDINGYKSCQATTGTSPPTPEPSSNPEPLPLLHLQPYRLMLIIAAHLIIKLAEVVHIAAEARVNAKVLAKVYG